jgi:hypothetical protein
MKEELYFETGGEGYCYPLSHFYDRICDGEKEIFLKLAKREIGSGFMWCKIESEFVESRSGTCGEFCEHYNPRNGKSGRCVHLDNSFIAIGKDLILTKDGLDPKHLLNNKKIEK